MKKLLIVLTLIAGNFMFVSAETTVTFMNKIYNLQYSKKIGKSSYLEVFNYLGEKSVIIKGLFTIEDAESKALKDEMANATKDIIEEDTPQKLNKSAWSKVDIINNTFYIMGSCMSIDGIAQKYTCTYNRTKYINNNTQVEMFVYTKNVTIPANSKMQIFLDNEYEKIKPNLEFAK